MQTIDAALATFQAAEEKLEQKPDKKKLEAFYRAANAAQLEIIRAANKSVIQPADFEVWRDGDAYMPNGLPKELHKRVVEFVATDRKGLEFARQSPELKSASAITAEMTAHYLTYCSIMQSTMETILEKGLDASWKATTKRLGRVIKCKSLQSQSPKLMDI